MVNKKVNLKNLWRYFLLDVLPDVAAGGVMEEKKGTRIFRITGRWGTGLDKETIKEMYERGEVYEFVGDKQEDSEKREK